MYTALAALYIVLMDDKESLRKEAIRHRDFIDPAEDHPEDAVSQFLEAIKPQKGLIVAGYWPKGREFDCRPVLDEVLKLGCECALPVVQKDTKILKFALWSDGDELSEGAFGIMEPVSNDWVEPDILIIPMLAFDRHGNRLGYGGGYYDATIADLKSRKDILCVGMAYGQQAVLFNLPAEDHDQPMDWIITPQNAIEHKQAA